MMGCSKEAITGLRMEEAPNMAMAAVTNTDMVLATAMPVRRRAGSLATLSNTGRQQAGPVAVLG